MSHLVKPGGNTGDIGAESPGAVGDIAQNTALSTSDVLQRNGAISGESLIAC